MKIDDFGLRYPLSSNIMTHMAYIIKGLRDVLRSESPLNIAQYRVLGLLIRTPSMITPAEVAKRLRLSPSAVAETLNSLIAYGCINFLRNDDDRRSKYIEVLPAGIEMASVAEHAAAVFVHKLWQPLNQQQKRLMLDGCLKNDLLSGTHDAEHDSARGILLYIENACAVTDKMTQATRAGGLSLNEFRILFELASNTRTVCGSDLSRRLILHSNEVAKAVTPLIGHAYLEQSSDPYDQRIKRLNLTKVGWAITAQVAPAVDEVFLSGTYQTTKEERAGFLRIADLVVGELLPLR